MLKNLQKLAIAVAAAGALVACDNDGSGLQPTVLVKGKAAGSLLHAICSASPAANPSQTIGRATTTGPDGSFTIDSIPTQPNPFPVVVTCTDGTYFNTATGTVAANTLVLKSLASAGLPSTGVLPKAAADGNIGLNILTTLAASEFLRLPAEQRNAANVQAKLTEIAQGFAPGLDISAVATPISGANANLGTSDADVLALILAGLDGAADNAGTDLATFINTIADDLADGLLDGLIDGTPAGLYTSFNDLVADIDAGIDAFVAENPGSGDTAAEEETLPPSTPPDNQANTGS